MKRTTGAMVLLAALSGCVTMDSGGGCGGGGYMSQVWNPPPVGGGPGGAHCGGYQVASVPGVVGPWGQPVAATGPYTAVRADQATVARMVSTSVPLDVFQQTMAKNAQPGSGIVQAQALAPAPGALPAYGASPGFSLGVGNMGCPAAVPGCAMPAGMPGGYPVGAVAAVGTANSRGVPSAPQRTEVRLVGPAGMKVSWYAPTPDGKAGFSSQYLEAPGRYNFMQAAIYRLKLSDIPNRPGVELYPTLEVVPTNHRTSTFLAHSAVPVSFTEEDFQQVAAGNYVVKVIYLPDPQFQDLASTGPDEVVSSRLEPGADPIAEAHRRGSILLVVRIGNIDLEAPNTPPMDAPSQYAPRVPVPPGFAPPGGMHPLPGGPVGPPAPDLPQPILPPVGPMSKAPAKSDVQQVSHEQPAPAKSMGNWWRLGSSK
jgi:hypothetical protein